MQIPFSVPPYMSLLARSTATLEGIALMGDPGYQMVSQVCIVLLLLTALLLFLHKPTDLPYDMSLLARSTATLDGTALMGDPNYQNGLSSLRLS